MEVCRLCLDLLHGNNFFQLDGPYRALINSIAPEVNLEISSNPVVCKPCSSSIDELHKFKNQFIENEQRIKQKCNGEFSEELSLKEILHGVNVGEIVVTEKAKERICRTCLNSIDCESFTVLKPSKPDAYLDSMITMCLPELDLQLSRDPVMCEKCLSFLQKLHHLKTSCLDIEEKIKNYCTNHGTNSSAQINLLSVLDPLTDDKKDLPNYPTIQSEVKTEKDIDVEMNNMENKTNNENNHDPLVVPKVEDMEIKTEECNWITLEINDPWKEDMSEGDEDLVTPNYTSLQYADLNNEVDEDHRIVPCDQCNEKFKNKERMLVHRMQHFGKQPPTCEKCGAQFASNGSLNFHKKIHLARKPYKCKVCDRQFANKSNYDKHAQSHTENNFYACDQCDELFLNYQRLKVHKLIHIGKDPLVCEICNMTFPYKSAYKCHRNTHLDKSEQPYPCDVCGSRFALKSIMLTHRVIHFGERPHACTLCDMRFTQKSNLKKHILLHSGEKPFVCDVCKKRFFTKHTLQSHLETHYGAKPYKCNECEETFRHKARLEVHKLSHKGKEPFKCDICGGLFAHQWTFKSHRQTHEGQKPFECSVCGKRFVKEWILTSHMRIHTGDYPFECNICGRRYVDKGKLNFHQKQKCLNPSFPRSKLFKNLTKLNSL